MNHNVLRKGASALRDKLDFLCFIYISNRERSNPDGSDSWLLQLAYSVYACPRLIELVLPFSEINLRDVNGQTALHIFAVGHNSECMNKLVELGATMETRDMYGG